MKRTAVEEMHDVCACGDWRKSHFMGRGKCGTCGDGNAPPNGPDGCREFRVFKECRMTFQVVITPGRQDAE